jgi:hypothetical protein
MGKTVGQKSGATVPFLYLSFEFYASVGVKLEVQYELTI